MMYGSMSALRKSVAHWHVICTTPSIPFCASILNSMVRSTLLPLALLCLTLTARADSPAPAKPASPPAPPAAPAALSNLPKVRLHDLRHTVATLLLHEGAHPKVVQELLGHANVAITLNTYSHATPGLHREAADMLEGVLKL